MTTPAADPEPAAGRDRTAGARTDRRFRTPEPKGFGLPRVLIIVLGAAAGVVVVAGHAGDPGHHRPGVHGVGAHDHGEPDPLLADPPRVSRGLASLAVFLTVFAIVAGLFAAAIIGIVQLATLMPQYADQIQQQLDSLASWLAGLGISEADLHSIFSSIEPSQLVAAAQDLLAGISGIFSFLLFMIVVLIFLAVDATVYDDRMAQVRPAAKRCSTRWACSPAAPASTSAWPPSSAASSPSWTAPSCCSWASPPPACGRCWPSSPTTSPTSGSSSA